MKLKCAIAFVVVHFVVAVYESAAQWITGQGTGDFPPMAVMEFINAFTPEKMDFTLDIWSENSLIGTIANAITSSYRLLTFGGYEAFLGEGSGIPSWVRTTLSIYGHLMLLAIIWHLFPAAIRSYVRFGR